MPITEDVNFDCINLDMETLKQVQKSNIWLYLVEKLPLHLRYGKNLSIDELVSFHPSYEEPLFAMNQTFYFYVEKMYKWLLKLTGVIGQKTSVKNEKRLQNLIGLCLEKDKVIADELYLTLIKLLRKNPDEKSVTQTWQVMASVCSTVEPGREFGPCVFNYFYQLINHHPQDAQKEWARICLKRLYQLARNKFKKNFAPGSLEVRCTQIRKKIPIYVYFRNGACSPLFVEPYTTVGDVFKGVMREMGVEEQCWRLWGLFECVARQKTFNEQLLSEEAMVADVIASWDILRKLGGDPVLQTRLYFGLKFFPVLDDNFALLQREIFFETLFSVYFGKMFVERYNLIKLWGLAMQVEFGDFEEKPGFIERQLPLYFQEYYQKYYKNEKFVQDTTEYYKSLAGRAPQECLEEFFEIAGEGRKELSRFFKVSFRNSNNPNFKDMQPNVILAVNRNALLVQEESSRENILRIPIEDVMNWGINKDILVVCYGDRFEMTKLYFQCYNPYEVLEVLFSYAQAKVTQTQPLLAHNPDLDLFILNSKTRKVNVFTYK